MKLNLNKTQGKLLKEVIQHWGTEGIIDDITKEKLISSYQIKSFEWKKLARYSFWIAIVCVVISVGSIFADELLIDLIERLFSSSYLWLSAFFAAMAIGFYYWSFVRKKKHPHKAFSNEFIVVLGVLSTATTIAYLGKALDNGSGHFSILLLMATFVYGFVGLSFPSKLVWCFAILSLGAWFGAETGYVSGWGAYYLGMNYPLRFVAFGASLTGLSFLFGYVSRLRIFQKTTFQLGLLYLFIALWILSIFGNYGDWYEWSKVKQIHLLGWGIAFGVVAILAILFGLKYDNYTSRSFGVTFLFINLYTRFFEYFWDMSHKAIFFLVLAITFWLVGKNAEKIWNLEFLTKKEVEE